jgi:hypothetical protein
MNHKWKQSYIPDGKYNRLYQAQRLLAVAKLTILMDRLEPIEDVTDAAKYLNKFKLEK